MIHVWWRQCHCDLYRLALAGFRGSPPAAVLPSLDAGFVQHCRRQCLDHSLAMVGIFSAMQRLGVELEPVADLDLALCAYQCVRMLRHVYLVDADGFGLAAEAITDQANICLQAVRQCCRGPAATAIASELASWIGHGVAALSPPPRLASPGTLELDGGSPGPGPARRLVMSRIELSDDRDVVTATRSTVGPAPANRGSRLSLPSATTADDGFGQAQRRRGRSAAGADLAPPELNNAYPTRAPSTAHVWMAGRTSGWARTLPSGRRISSAGRGPT